jgi:hypothetical protein
MEAAVVLVALAVAIGVGIVVAWPLLRQSDPGQDAAPADRKERLEDQLEASLKAIREIELDHQSGGLSDEDFETLNQDERTRAVALMRRLDALEEGDDPKSAPTKAISEVSPPSRGADVPPPE